MDEHKQFFEIPNDTNIMMKLVEVIPNSWSWIDGVLSAPKTLIDSGKAVAGTGYEISRFHSIHPTIKGIYRDGKEQKPNLYAMIAEGKLPGFVSFHEAGYDIDISFELAKKIAIAYLEKGYRGWLGLYSDCYDNSKYENPAACNIHFKPWEKGRFSVNLSDKNTDDNPPVIEVNWTEKYGGKPELVQPIISLCHSLGLKELVPVS